MFKKCLISSLLLLSACDPNPIGSDGYSFGQKQFERQTVQVNVVTYHTQSEFNKSLLARKLPPETIAYTILRPPFDTCTIHMIDPAIKYAPEFIGHEFAHCAYGQWHTDNNSRG